VDLFDCNGVAACIIRRAAALRSKGFTSVLAGEYAVQGETYEVRLRTLSLQDGKLLDQQRFSASRSDLESVDGWSKPFRQIFDDTGTIRLQANVSDYRCLLDGQPCKVNEQGILIGVREGEHVVTLEKRGYRPAQSAVTVTRRQEAEVPLSLSRLPAQVQVVADPNARIPVFVPTEGGSISPSLMILGLAWMENVGNGSPSSRPTQGPQASWRAGVSNTLLVLAARAQLPKLGNWVLSAVVGNEFASGTAVGYAEANNPDLGLKFVIGILFPGPVNSLAPGLVHHIFDYGNLFSTWQGLVISKSFGPFLFEAGASKPRGSASFPGFLGRAAYISPEVKGSLYGVDYPLTVSLSGWWGLEGLGVGEEAQVAALSTTAAPPVHEELPFWIGSFEMVIPAGKYFTLAGEAYVGDGTDALNGALQQGARIDLSTGLHHQLRSLGGWLQLAYHPWPRWDFLAFIGQENVVTGLGQGVQLGATLPAIRQNRVVALEAYWAPLPHFTLAAEVYRVDGVFVSSPQKAGGFSATLAVIARY
jgi:hypothetical protein